jgi:hypothetical protein
MRSMALAPVQASGIKLHPGGTEKSPWAPISAKTQRFPGQTAPPRRIYALYFMNMHSRGGSVKPINVLFCRRLSTKTAASTPQIVDVA